MSPDVVVIISLIRSKAKVPSHSLAQTKVLQPNSSYHLMVGLVTLLWWMGAVLFILTS